MKKRIKDIITSYLMTPGIDRSSDKPLDYLVDLILDVFEEYKQAGMMAMISKEEGEGGGDAHEQDEPVGE